MVYHKECLTKVMHINIKLLFNNRINILMHFEV